jgi:hypothetical protein
MVLQRTTKITSVIFLLRTQIAIHLQTQASSILTHLLLVLTMVHQTSAARMEFYSTTKSIPCLKATVLVLCWFRGI